MSQNHVCNACTGTKYDGANLKCHLCLKPSFFECMVKNKRHEAAELINVIKTQSNMTPGTRMQTRLQNIFGDSSVFVFICPNCKANRSLCDIIELYKTQANVDSMNKIQLLEKREKECEIQLTNERNTVANLMHTLTNTQSELESAKLIKTQLNVDNIKLQSDNMTVNTQLNEMNQQIANLTQQIEDLKQNDTERMDYTSCDEDTVAGLKALIKREMQMLTSEVEARITLECNKMKSEISGTLNANELSAKRKKTNIPRFGAFTNTQNNNNNNSVNGSSSINNLNNAANANASAMNSEVIANSQSSHLKPPEAATDKNDRGVYEIYVSKFHSEQSEDGIANHIVEKTGINIGQFRVIKLTSRRDPKNNYYASFKIVTIDVNVYNSISNQMLWGEYEVRDFEPDKPKKFNNQRTMKKRNENQHREPRQVNGRDMRRSVLDRNTFDNHGRYESQNNFHNNETPRRPLTPRFGARYGDSPQRQSKFDQNRPPRFNNQQSFNESPRFNKPPRFRQQQQNDNRNWNFQNNGQTEQKQQSQRFQQRQNQRN